MNITVQISTPDALEEWERAVIQTVLGVGAFDDVDFVVYWRKYIDHVHDAPEWNCWPFRRDMGSMYRVDHPTDWKHTWFVFTHS